MEGVLPASPIAVEGPMSKPSSPPPAAPPPISTPPRELMTAVDDVAASAPDTAPAAEAHQETQDAQDSPRPESTSGSGKDEDKAAVQPYGTRSRNRSGPRPNYADEPDYNFDAPPLPSEVVMKKHSTPLESTGAREASAGPDAPRTFTAANASTRPAVNGTTHAHPSDSSILPSSEAPPPRQKRKYTWKNGSRPSPGAKASHKDSIPGTSHFLAKHSETPDPPPSKRRKTDDAHLNGANGIVSGRRTASLQASKITARDTCVYTFEKSGAMLKDGKLRADDGTVFGVDDHVYLICEPPGEPYYLCRIMEFRKDDMNDPKAPITSMLVNWYYRPKDIGRFSIDARYLFASMQSDESPVMSLRGKCTILHRSEISDLDEYRKQRDTFWFNQLYDRYIHRPYDLLPAKSVINVPTNVKKAIDERWKFLAVEAARLKELTSAVKLCKRCNGYCASQDSVDCGVCRNTYHMACVRPPIFKKPSRGFAWSCGPCSRAQEKRLQARHTAILPDAGADADEDAHEDDDEAGAIPVDSATAETEKVAHEADNHTQAEVAKAQMWPWRYLGIHCSIEDVLQYDDRAIYPRASSRLGARHQTAMTPWYGRPVELVKPLDIKKKVTKGVAAKNMPKYSKETQAAIEADKIERANRPKWVQDEPPGYVARGEDYDPSDERCTAERLFVVPPDSKPSFAAANVKGTSNERVCDEFMNRLKEVGRQSGFTRHIFPSSKDGSQTEPQVVLPTNYIDLGLKTLCKHNFDAGAALEEMRTVKGPKAFKDPVLSQDELKKFEDGVAKFGSELRLVRKHVKSRPHGDIVRFYYIWKKTERGQQIWGRHDARRGSRKRAETSWTDIADDEDDSAFDNAKSFARKRKFQCKFCLTRHSRQWRRAPNVAPGAVALLDPKGSAKDRSNQLVIALCQRCAIPWRRYALRWEDPEEFAKSIGSSGKQWKRLQDEHMLREFVLANEAARVPTTGNAALGAAMLGIELTVPLSDPASKRKEKEYASTPAPVDPPKKKAPVAPPPRPPTPPIMPQEPRLRDFPCAVCLGEEVPQPTVTCISCKLTVHRRCYAVPDSANGSKWICDTCTNDKTGLVSFNYNCVLCTVADRQPDMVEPPRVSHKKKNDRDRERERQEKHLADRLAAEYRRDQLAKGRPPFPRDAVKRTTSNNWMHVTCAVWTPEIKFAEAARMENAEGMGVAMANPARMDSPCKLCRITGGAVVACNYDKCGATFHVGCAHEAGHRFGFDIKPVKSTQKSNTPTLTIGAESGLMTAVIYCKDHDPANTPILHDINEVHGETGWTALQVFVDTYKQADLTYTGTARKANMLSQSTKAVAQATQAAVPAAASRRASLLNSSATSAKGRRFSAASASDDINGLPSGQDEGDRNECVSCGTDVSFRWWCPARANSASRQVFELPAGAKHEQPVQCHRCHVVVEEGGMPPTPPKSDVEEEGDSFLKRDFFELTMPPPPPAPLAQQFSQAPLVPNWPGDYPPEHAPREPYVNNIDNDADLEGWTRALWACTVVLAAPNGRQINFRGEEFGSLNDPPMVAWNHVVRRMQDEGQVDMSRHVLISQEGLKINGCNSLMTALASIIKKNANQVHWHVTDIAMHGPPPPPPPPPVQQHASWQPPTQGSPMPMTPGSMQHGHPAPPHHYGIAPPSSRSGSVAPPTPRIQGYQAPPAPPVVLRSDIGNAAPSTNGISHHYQGQLQHQHDPRVENMAPEVRGEMPGRGHGSSGMSPYASQSYVPFMRSTSGAQDGSTSPKVKEEGQQSRTPNGQTSFIGPTTSQPPLPHQGSVGASSSPNLKNLVH